MREDPHGPRPRASSHPAPPGNWAHPVLAYFHAAGTPEAVVPNDEEKKRFRGETVGCFPAERPSESDPPEAVASPIVRARNQKRPSTSGGQENQESGAFHRTWSGPFH